MEHDDATGRWQRSGPELGPGARLRMWLAGMVIGNLVVGLLYGLGLMILEYGNALRLLGVPSFLLMPSLGGLVASYFWRGCNPTVRATCLNTLWMGVLALAGAALVFREGIICLVILFPLYYACSVGGALVGRLYFMRDPTHLRVCLLPLVFLAILAEPGTRVERQSVVTDEMLIHAAPAKVWPQLTSFPEIPSPPRFWLFRLGLPYPEATTVTGDVVNADRRCIFSHGAVFKERVAELVPREKLTFDIVEIPKDPELVGHLTPHRGQFVLRDNGDGTTLLVGSTWYTLHVRPLWYFDLWTRHIFRSVHLRVMEDIRRRAEAPR